MKPTKLALNSMRNESIQSNRVEFGSGMLQGPTPCSAREIVVAVAKDLVSLGSRQRALEFAKKDTIRVNLVKGVFDMAEAVAQAAFVAAARLVQRLYDTCM